MRCIDANHVSHVEGRAERAVPLALVLLLIGGACAPAADIAMLPDSGTAVVHYIERPIGQERYTVRPVPSGFELATELAYLERGSRGRLTSTLLVGEDGSPTRFQARGNTYRFVRVDVEVTTGDAGLRVRNLGGAERIDPTGPWFPVRGYAPLAGRAALIAYWEASGRPAAIRAVPGRDTDVIHIARRGVDTVQADAGAVVLHRYAVEGVVWGREAVWLDEAGRFAAVFTRIHILPLEAIRSDLVEALPQLQAVAVRDRMDDLARAAEQIRPVARDAFAIVGGRLVDGTGAAAVEDATIVVRGSRIAAVGPSESVSLPDGLPVLDGTGSTVLPGLWDVHAHASQIEWARAYLAAGVTTIRDVGGEVPFLTALRDATRAGEAVGPRVLLAGLVDGADSLGFGATVADTEDEGVGVVRALDAEGFEEVMVYGRVQPHVLRAISDEARHLGMRVTGHVPASMSAAEAVAAGLDGVTHLRYAVQGAGPTELDAAIRALVRAGTVVSPAVVWTELLGRSLATPIATFEPGIDAIAGPLALNYESAGQDISPEEARAALDESLGLLKRMHDAGVVIAAGTDAGVPGFSLLREVELYVEAGMSPMDAIRSATAVPARVMGLADEVGTLEVGKRADLLVVRGDPLADIGAVRRARWVVANGIAYAATALREGSPPGGE